jgi:hypothetical protein
MYRAEWSRFKNKELVVLLSRLKDITYDAEDILREFGDQLPQQRMEDTNRSRALQLVSSSFNILFKNWISGSKRRVLEAQTKLDIVVNEMEGALNLIGIIDTDLMQHMPETSSVIGVPEVMGREEERDLVIEMLGVMIAHDNNHDQVMELLHMPLPRYSRSAGGIVKKRKLGRGVTSASRAKLLKGNSKVFGPPKTDCTKNVSVFAIVGLAGVGKTTLAQAIFNDKRVDIHFDLKIWVCVSDLFCKRRITKEIIESIPGEEFNLSCSLDALYLELRRRLTNRKFLLVLDDVWPNANDDWDTLYAPLMQETEGSMVLVTTRFPVVADLVTNSKSVKLDGLPTDIFWQFFKKCAFGKHQPESYPQLQEIGQSIASRLCGSPLAAKTLGRLLNGNLTEKHWRGVQNSELWDLSYEKNDILPSLQLSYLYLPQQLKRCFVVCSMFPKGYSFERKEIVGLWVAQGFVGTGGSMYLEDEGLRYLDDLRSRFLLQTDPKFPKRNRYVMHDLIHDMAQSVSVGECIVIRDLSSQNQWRTQQTVRHMSVEMGSESLSELTRPDHLTKLHSLRFAPRLKVEISWFNHLSNILFLSLKHCSLVELPDSICSLNHLCHLDISHSCIRELPKKIGCLYSLQVLDASYSSLQTVDKGVTKLVNLRRLVLPGIPSSELSMMSGLGNLSSLQNLSHFVVGTGNGHRICELKDMNQLSGTLTIQGIAEVLSSEEAAKARLVDKQYLRNLVLEWRRQGWTSKSADYELLEALRPPSGIEYLKVRCFLGDNFSPSWLNPQDLPSVRRLELSGCHYMQSLAVDDRMQHASINCNSGIVRGPFTSLTTLSLAHCERLINIDHILSPRYMPSVKSIEIVGCSGLVSLPVQNFVRFVCLQDLKIQSCQMLVCLTEMVLPHSLQRLSISFCGELDRSLRPGFLENLTSLTLLHLICCHNVESVQLNSMNNKLKCLVLSLCSELLSIGGSCTPSSIRHVDISDCPKLTEIQQPLLKKGLTPKQEEELVHFMDW